MGKVVNFRRDGKHDTDPNIGPREVIGALANALDEEACEDWRFLVRLNELLGYSDVPQELPGVDTAEIGDLMDLTYGRVRELKENAYSYHLAMCEKEGRNVPGGSVKHAEDACDD